MQQVTITKEMTLQEAEIGLSAAMYMLDYFLSVDDLLINVYDEISVWQGLVDQLDV